MADQNTQLTPEETPAQKYRRRLEGMVHDLLKSIVSPAQLQEAKGRVGLAFRTAALAAPDLYSARPESLASALAMSAITGLMPGGPMPLVYLLPRKEKNPETGRWDIQGVQWYLSWRGMKKLVERTGAHIEVIPVFDGDVLKVTRGLHPDIIHEPIEDPDMEYESLRGVYVVCRHADGSHDFVTLGKTGIEKRRMASDSKDRGPWVTWPVEQAMKTGIRYAIARGIAPVDESGMHAFDADEQGDRRQVIDVMASERPAPAPERIATPPRSSVQRLADTLGPDSEDEDTREADPVPVGQPEPEKTKRTRGPNKPKPETAMREAERVVDGAVKDFNERHDEAKLNNQHELLLRVQEAERKVGGNILTSRTAHGISPTLNASQVVKQCPEAAVIAYCRELEA